MIKNLKIKFILLASLSLFVLLLVIVSGMNFLNYNAVVRESDDILALISQNKGTFPNFDGAPGNRLPPGMSPELPAEARYFSVVLNSDGAAIRAETSRILSVDPEKAMEYAVTVVRRGNDRGFLDRFRYAKTIEGDTTRITFLDCGRRLDAFHRFLAISVAISAAGFFIVVFVISFFSGRIIRPIAESYEKQKRFITDAGHEIKTPLTIISANADILEMDIGKNECLEDIQQQTKRLTELTNDLVDLARMEEATLPMIEFPVSEVVQETAQPFQAPAQAQGKAFFCQVQPMLSMRGNAKAIAQLVSIFLDNAIKYSPTGGTISLTFAKQNRMLLLTVCNTTEVPVTPDQLDHLFDRFYRTDPSRNSQTGGHGIGLSMAKAIVTAHGGKINACMRENQTFQISALLPIS